MPLHLRHHGHSEATTTTSLEAGTTTGSQSSPTTTTSHDSPPTGRTIETQSVVALSPRLIYPRHRKRPRRRMLMSPPILCVRSCRTMQVAISLFMLLLLLSVGTFWHWGLSWLLFSTHNTHVSRKIISEHASSGTTTMQSFQPPLTGATTKPAVLRATGSSATTTSMTPATVTIRPSVVTPLEDKDTSQYTVRINTWQRPDQLRVSIQHFLTCERVAMVQVVWCTAQGVLPDWLTDWQTTEPRLTVETHAENSLNARFDVLAVPPTKGILSVDDDVLRPCFALDATFAKWTSHPDRLVGFDARTHVQTTTSEAALDGSTTTKWKYGYLSETTRTNRYSISLSRFAFVHVDHLYSYTHNLSAAYRQFVTDHMNCEDILLSFWISHVTACQPPLLADTWAMKSMIKMWSPKTISGTSSHKEIRDECVDMFAKGLQLDNCLQATEWIHADVTTGQPSFWDAGAPAKTIFVQNQASIEHLLHEWKTSNDVMEHDYINMVQETALLPYQAGLIQGSPRWKTKYGHASGGTS